MRDYTTLVRKLYYTIDEARATSVARITVFTTVNARIATRATSIRRSL